MNRFIVIIAALFITFATVATAWSHAKISNSTPADGATVAAGLDTVTMNFSKDVRMTMVKLVRSSDGAEVAIMSDMPKGFTRAVSVTVAPLAGGPYEAHWIAVAKDGHVMKGSFSFTVDA